MPRIRNPFLVVCLLSVSAAIAQEGPPAPAAELKALNSLVGSWTGSGTMTEPGASTPWTADGTYRWCMDGQFLREDFAIAFEGNPQKLVFRSYLGWDHENKHYVNVIISNGGEARLNELKVLPDGTMLQLMMQDMQGMPYAERSLFKLDGDTMTHTIDLLMADGPSMQMVDGKFTRGGKGFDGAFEGGTFMDVKPHADMKKMVRMVGSYDIKGTMVPAPGAPAMTITGTETYTAVFGGVVLQVHTDGTAEGMPGKYESEAFWAHDNGKDRLCCVFLDNMGSVGTMEGFFTPDDKALIGISASLVQGQPTAQRYVTKFDAKGGVASAAGHTIAGTADPAETFAATYTRK